MSSNIHDSVGGRPDCSWTRLPQCPLRSSRSAGRRDLTRNGCQSIWRPECWWGLRTEARITDCRRNVLGEDDRWDGDGTARSMRWKKNRSHEGRYSRWTCHRSNRSFQNYPSYRNIGELHVSTVRTRETDTDTKWTDCNQQYQAIGIGLANKCYL